MNTFNQLVQERQSVRAYKNQPVPKEHVTACLEAARMAPSACNSQPWKYIVVDDPQKAAQVAEGIYDPAMGINKFVTSVPVFVVLVQEKAKLMKSAEERYPSNYWADFDNGATVAYFCLQATELGLGTCVIGSYSEDKIKSALAIPEDKMVRMVIALGYSESQVIRPKSRKSLEEITSYNGY